MRRFLKKEKGFSLVELLIVIGIIGILATIVIMNMRGSETGAKETKLKANLANLRQALFAFNSDHGFFPCTSNDDNFKGNVATFKRQLTWYTDADGRTSAKRTDEFRFGPYLQEFPSNPFYQGTDESEAEEVEIDTRGDQILENLKDQVAKGNGNNGWYYQAKSGNIVANLGGSAFSDEYCYF
ncbi:prepilin-type N-terminal cleavage/methylation domain-containing protein [candidate division KSB1 bacterium]|nr:prepilin-type N-terminal cleavage/methylation domain-containing protein [candidate division KSB1 bacterium]